MNQFIPKIVTAVLVYIGNDAVKEDNVCQTGVSWFGYGDKQEVPRNLLPKFLQHPDVWVTEEDFAKIGLDVENVIAYKGKQYTVTENSDESLTLVLVGRTLQVAKVDQVVAPEGSPDGSDDDEDGNPDADDELKIKITNAILTLEEGNDAHFSKSNGVPIVSAVRLAASDDSITAAQIKAVWAELKAN